MFPNKQKIMLAVEMFLSYLPKYAKIRAVHGGIIILVLQEGKTK